MEYKKMGLFTEIYSPSWNNYCWFNISHMADMEAFSRNVSPASSSLLKMGRSSASLFSSRLSARSFILPMRPSRSRTATTFA